MLVTNQSRIILKRESKKILQFSTAFDQTYVYLEVVSPGSSERITHINQQGQIIWEITFKDTINCFGMISQKDIVVIDTINQQICLINLQKKDIRAYNHKFNFDQTSQMAIQAFSQTRYLTIVEHGCVNENRLALSYYNVIKGQLQLATRFESKEEDYLDSHIIKKANNHSMIAWFPIKQYLYFQIRFFDLKDSLQGNYHKINIPNTMGVLYNLQQLQCNVESVWECKHNVFMLICSTNRPPKYEGEIINNNLVWDRNTNTIRETNFLLKQDWNEHIIQTINLGQYSIFYTYKFESRIAQRSPIFYVNILQQKVIAEEFWMLDYDYIYAPGYDQNVVIQIKCENSDVKEIIVNKVRIIVLKEMLLHFMLHINEDFDDDFLKDAIELIQLQK